MPTGDVYYDTTAAPDAAQAETPRPDKTETPQPEKRRDTPGLETTGFKAGSVEADLWAGIVEAYQRHRSRDGEETVAGIQTLAETARDAAQAHDGQHRKTGEAYITHPLAVTALLAEAGGDLDTLQAGLLHDTVEDTPITTEDIASDYGDDVAHIVEGVTKIDQVRYQAIEEAQAATIRKMVIAMAADVRVIIVKLADRLHNLRTIDPMPERIKERVSVETLQIYAPLAARLGIETWKHELEERAFKVARPDEWAYIDEQVGRHSQSRDQELAEIAARLGRALSDAGVEGRLEGREKHYYSIWRKMADQGRSFEDIYDLIGLRFVCETEADCYAALGVAHATYPHVAGRFYDHIAMPKPNGYRSLHTTLVAGENRPFELQIRTEEMHHAATYGAAAHWRYKETPDHTKPRFSDRAGEASESRQAAGSQTHKRGGGAGVYEESAREARGELEYYQDLVAELETREEVYVLTPDGEPVALPEGATPVDFAYRIHTEVGHGCRGAKVNGRLVELSRRLASGDTVEIITTSRPDAAPSRHWLEFVVSTTARTKIRRRLEEERSEEYEERGREIISGFEASSKLSKARYARTIDELAEACGYPSAEALYRAVGAGKLPVDGVEARFERISGVEAREPAGSKADSSDTGRQAPEASPGVGRGRTPREARAREKLLGRHSRAVIVDGWPGVEVRFAECCQPDPGDEIVGYVTVARGVSVHRAACENVAGLATDRLVEVAWEGYDDPRTGWIRIEAVDRTGLLVEVSGVISDAGANIVATHAHTTRDQRAVLRIRLEVSGPDHLEVISGELADLEGVLRAVIEVR